MVPRRSLTVTIIIGPFAVGGFAVVLDCCVEELRASLVVLDAAGLVGEGTCFAAAFAPNLDAIEGPNLEAVLRLVEVLSVSLVAGVDVEVVSVGATELSLLLVADAASLSFLLLRSVLRSLSFLLSRGRESRPSPPSRSRYLSRDSRSSDAGALLFHFRPFEMPGSRLLDRRGLRERSRLCDGAMVMCICECVW